MLAMPPNLVFVSQDPSLPIADITLEAGEYVLGRSGQSDIPILDITISRQHARLQIDSDQIVIADLGSRNKTFVNGKSIEKATAKVGDEVRFGRVAFRVVKGADYAPRPDTRELDTGIHKHSSPALELDELRSLLTPAQLRVMSCILAGHSEKETGRKLGISHHTVHNHIREIYSQMKVQSRAELLSLFIPPNLPAGGELPNHLRMTGKTVDDIPIIED